MQTGLLRRYAEFLSGGRNPARAGFRPVGHISDDEPATAILSEPPALAGGDSSEPGAVATVFPASESSTKPQVQTTDQTATIRTGAEAEPQESLGGLTNGVAKPQGRVGSRNRLFAVVGVAVGSSFRRSDSMRESVCLRTRIVQPISN
jgi:hypothetical protein